MIALPIKCNQGTSCIQDESALSLLKRESPIRPQRSEDENNTAVAASASAPTGFAEDVRMVLVVAGRWWEKALSTISDWKAPRRRY